jgi:hypothetical protein
VSIMPTTSGGFGAGIMSGVPGIVKPLDKPYTVGFNNGEFIDLPWFTSVLINAGYRTYQLLRADSRLRQIIWAQPIVDLIRMDRRQVRGWEPDTWGVKSIKERERYEAVPVLRYSIPYERIALYAAGEVKEVPIKEASLLGVVVLMAEDDGELVNELGRVRELTFA